MVLNNQRLGAASYLLQDSRAAACFRFSPTFSFSQNSSNMVYWYLYAFG
jgi:hypothetical protein